MVCPRGDCATDSSESHGGPFIRANVNQAAHVDVAVSEDEAIEEENADVIELLSHLQARADDEFGVYAKSLYNELHGTCREKMQQLQQLLATKRPVWQGTMSKILKNKVTPVIERLKKPLMHLQEWAAFLNHDLSNEGSNLEVHATFDYEISVNGTTVAAIPKVGVLEA